MARQVRKAADPGIPRRPRGRPPGSISLTKEMEDKILTLLGAGASESQAADVAGVKPRTLREWKARAEGRSDRPATRKILAFVKKVGIAKAMACVDAEIRLFRDNPKLWLQMRMEREGSSESRPDEREGRLGFSLDLADYQDEAVRAELFRVHELMLGIEPKFVIPGCLDSGCSCIWHKERKGAAAKRAAARIDREPSP